jgi:tetratricopeptide (TPR) repeat protein
MTSSRGRSSSSGGRVEATTRAVGDAVRAKGRDVDDDAKTSDAMETARGVSSHRRRKFLSAGLAALAGAATTRATAPEAASAALPKELTQPDEIFTENFIVKFAGLEVDHKDLISLLIVGQTIGFVGSAVGGAEARRRAEEIERLNATLLKVNKEVRKELRSSQGRKVTLALDSMDENSNDIVVDILGMLKTGKAKLKSQAASEAKQIFSKARTLIVANETSLKEPWKALRKAERGLGAAAVRLGEFEEALVHMKTVLSLSTEHDDTSVATDAYGIIADIYAEMDQIEVAADWYDKYFESLAIEDAKEAAETAQSRSAR